ncbi:MAG: hypothetical protein R3A44_42935 [Caldilineaceae bacterium]
MIVVNNKAEVVAAALELDRVCYYWSVTLDPETALTFARQCQEMNAASPAALVYLIERINAYVPRIDFGPDNPNTGKTHHDFVIGAENSRFVDLKIAKSYLKQWTAQEWQAFANFLHLLGYEVAADIKRVTQDDADEYVFSFWWD